MEPNRGQQCMLNMTPHIISITKDDKLAKPFILLGGFLFSLWTFCIFVAGCDTNIRYDSNISLIVLTSLATHVMISLAATKWAYHGLKHQERVFLKPWMAVKVVEGVLMFTGSILCATGYRTYIGLTIVGILLLMAGVYITMCVYTTYKQMVPPSSTLEDTIPEHPPAYDSFTNQKNLA